MTTNFFFDDYRVLSHDNVTRRQGTPELIPESVYKKGTEDACNVHPIAGVVYDPETRLYTMYRTVCYKGQNYGVADVSPDLIHWEPRNTGRAAGIQAYWDMPFENQYLYRYYNGETAFLFRDDRDIPERRYKACVNRNDLYGGVECPVIASPDGIHWSPMEGARWQTRGTEPCGSLVYSEEKGCYIIYVRPFVGERRVTVATTCDFIHFSDRDLAIWGDALDKPNTEIYGLLAFAYKGWYLGNLLIYETKNENSWKYIGGRINAQLAYSTNGIHWQRFLREPFFANHTDGLTDGMIFPYATVVMPDGEIRIVCTASKNEHGHFEDGGQVMTYRLREDGFAYYESDAGKTGRLFTRTVLMQGEKLTFNLDAKNVTFAAFDADGKPIEGFGHADCIPFSGNDTHMSPVFSGGRSFSDLKGQVFSIEIRFEGKLYAYEGDFINLTQMEAQQYRLFGRVPQTKGQN